MGLCVRPVSMDNTLLKATPHVLLVMFPATGVMELQLSVSYAISTMILREMGPPACHVHLDISVLRTIPLAHSVMFPVTDATRLQLHATTVQ